MTPAPWHVCVLIPARNEEALLPRCLRSVLEAAAMLPAGVTSDVIVVVDSSSDATLAIAERMLAQHGAVVTTNCGIVGEARAAGAALALRRYRGAEQRCWLANTDADCCVPPDWLVKQLAFADRGVEALAGIIDVDSYAEHHPWVAERFRDTYRIEPDGTHPHVHGANLSMRADAYLRAGGWQSLVTAEDHDLWQRLAECQRVSAGQVKVLTSGRRVGRAPDGFAQALSAHNGSAA